MDFLADKISAFQSLMDEACENRQLPALLTGIGALSEEALVQGVPPRVMEEYVLLMLREGESCRQLRLHSRQGWQRGTPLLTTCSLQVVLHLQQLLPVGAPSVTQLM